MWNPGTVCRTVSSRTVGLGECTRLGPSCPCVHYGSRPGRVTCSGPRQAGRGTERPSEPWPPGLSAAGRGLQAGLSFKWGHSPPRPPGPGLRLQAACWDQDYIDRTHARIILMFTLEGGHVDCSISTQQVRALPPTRLQAPGGNPGARKRKLAFEENLHVGYSGQEALRYQSPK